MEYWNSLLTEKSWKILQEIKKKYDFILIGGWATYLWTKQQKSKDIDIAVDLEELQKLKQEILIKNDRLKKYEIKFEDIDLDIYVSFFSELSIPIENLKKYSQNIEGFRVVSPEALMVLKQGAELSRRNSVKGEKDKIDIISLLLFTSFDLKKYYFILRENNKENYLKELIIIIKRFSDYNSVHLTPREFKLKKERILKEIKFNLKSVV